MARAPVHYQTGRQDDLPDRAIRAYIEASRGALHPMLSTDAAYADDVADALTPIGAEMRPFDTGMMHGPVQWLEGQAPSAPARHESQRLFTPVDVMPGQLSL
jgi:hypothetical protein